MSLNMATEGKKFKKKHFLFNGEWIPDQDPLKIGEQNYSELQNTRYTDTGLDGVSGFSKINSTPHATYIKGRSGIQLVTTYDTESRILVQAKNSGETASAIIQNTTSVPGTGDFAGAVLHTDASGAAVGRFAKWPRGAIAYCNGEESLIYAGDQMDCAGFLNYAPDGDFKYNYQPVISNLATDSENIATLYRVSESVDANTKLLLHLDNNVTDTVGTHTPVNNGAMAFDAATKVFGTHAASPDAGNDFIHVPDHADFVFSGGTFTVDCRVRLENLPGAATRFALYHHETAGTGNDWFEIYIDENGAVWARVCEDNVGVADYVVSLNTENGVIAADTWYHIEVVESGDNFYIFVDGVQRAYVSDTDRAADYTGNVQIGYNGDGAGFYLDGFLDEFRVSNSARHTGAFEIPIAAYGSATTRTYIYLGARRPLQGFKLTAGTANTTAGTLNVEYWDGTNWAGVGSLSDGTESGGKPLAQTGSVTFDTTVGNAKVKAIDSTVLFWYRVTITDCDATTTISHVTEDAPMQAVVDLWDGIFRTCISFQAYDNSTYNDYTLNVAGGDYSSANTATYAPLNALGTSDYFVAGFDERIMALNVVLVGGSVNTTASTILTVYYWDGDDWVSVGTLDDGTFENNASFAASGTISWNAPAHNTEFTTEISNEIPLYFYKFQFSQALSADVKVDAVYGIPAPRKIPGGYKFPFMFQNKPMLCAYESGKEGNRVDWGVTNTTEGHNGNDSSAGIYGPLYFGSSAEELNCAVELYNRFGSSIYNVAIFCKNAETWLLDGYDGETWRKKQISSNEGCPAPRTMDTAEVGFGVAEGARRNIAVWLSYKGPIVFDAAVLVPVRSRISNYFDKDKSECINYSAIERSWSLIDPDHMEWNLLFPSGSGQTECNKWLCLDLVRLKWFEKVPPTGKYPQAGFRVTDTNGAQYAFGMLDTGHLMHLDNGTTWDGTAIEQIIGTADLVPTGDMWDFTKIGRMKLAAVATSETTSAAIGHYADGKGTGTDLPGVSLTGTDRYIRSRAPKVDRSAFSHKFRFIVSTSATTKGFQPLAWSYQYEVVREDK